MSTPTPEPRADRNERNGLPLQLVAFLQIPGKENIFMFFDNGVIRHALPVEWNARNDTPVRTGTAADYTHAEAHARALRKD